jgi:hypothetical protein
VDTAGEELDIGLDALPIPGRFGDEKTRRRRR